MIAILLAVSVIPDGQSFDCTPTAVWDGDGPIWCKEGPHIRLSGIAAREIAGSCCPGHPCPSADPIAARDHLAKLVGTPQGKLRTGHVKLSGPTMRCRSAGGAGGTRTAAFCFSPKSGDLSCAMVRDGYASLLRDAMSMASGERLDSEGLHEMWFAAAFPSRSHA